MRSVFLLSVLVLLAACGDDDAAEGQRVDPALLTNSSGEVALTDGGSLTYVITSERYRKWDAAQRGLSRRVAARFGEILNPGSPSERSINRAVAYLESEPSARAAIEGAGMSVRDFVVMTVALEQQMQLAAARGAPPPVYSPDAVMDSGFLPLPPDTQPTPVYPQPYPYPQPQPYPPYPPTYPPPTYPSPAPFPVPVPAPRPTRDTARMDTVRVDTVLPRPSPVRDSIPRRDSQPARDTLTPRRDTTPGPRPADTLGTAPRDTPAGSPPDTLAST